HRVPTRPLLAFNANPKKRTRGCRLWVETVSSSAPARALRPRLQLERANGDRIDTPRARTAGDDARALLRPRLRLHDHAAHVRARRASVLARPPPSRVDARGDLVDVRRVRLDDERRHRS